MSGIATALGTLAAIVLVGWVLGRRRLLGVNAAPVLARITFTVTIPALLLATVAHADLGLLFSRTAVVTAVSTSVVIAAAVIVLRGVWHLGVGQTTVATLASSYLNAVHLGIPIAVYLVGDAVAVVPTLLFQQLLVAPVAFLLLDRARVGEEATGPDDVAAADDEAAVAAATRTRIADPATPADDGAASAATGAVPTADGGVGRAVRAGAVVRRTLRNPIILATLTGLLLAVLPWKLPEVVFEPFRVLGAAAAPMALIAFGMSLAVRRPEGQRLLTRELGLVIVLRAVVHPLAAALIGRALGLDGRALLAVVTMAALPTAQNVLVYALRYGRDQALARDAGLVTTLATIPVMLVIAATLG